MMKKNNTKKIRSEVPVVIQKPKTDVKNEPEEENYFIFPRWAALILAVLFTGLAVSVAITTVLLSLNKSSKLFNETCFDNRCSIQLGLECINGSCGCSIGNYYHYGCELRKTYLENCRGNPSNCIEDAELFCLDGVCKCIESYYYWNGRTCLPKKTFNESCQNIDAHCLNDQQLHCDSSKMKCLCENERQEQKIKSIL